MKTLITAALLTEMGFKEEKDANGLVLSKLPFDKTFIGVLGTFSDIIGEYNNLESPLTALCADIAGEAYAAAQKSMVHILNEATAVLEQDEQTEAEFLSRIKITKTQTLYKGVHDVDVLVELGPRE